MEKQRVIIYSGDTAQQGILILNHQPDGVYRYFPASDDDIKVILRRDEQIMELTADVSDPDYVFVDIDTSELETGTYYFDVVLTQEDEKHHIAVNQELFIKGGKQT